MFLVFSLRATLSQDRLEFWGEFVNDSRLQISLERFDGEGILNMHADYASTKSLTVTVSFEKKIHHFGKLVSEGSTRPAAIHDQTTGFIFTPAIALSYQTCFVTFLPFSINANYPSGSNFILFASTKRSFKTKPVLKTVNRTIYDLSRFTKKEERKEEEEEEEEEEEGEDEKEKEQKDEETGERVLDERNLGWRGAIKIVFPWGTRGYLHSWICMAISSSNGVPPKVH